MTSQPHQLGSLQAKSWQSSFAANILVVVPLVAILCLMYSLSPPKGNSKFKGVPIVGPKWTILARYRFFRNARVYVEQGYKEFKHTFFKLSAQDILVVPNKFVDELRSLPEEQLSSIQNFEGLYSTTSILLEGHLHTQTIQSKLTPSLAKLVPITERELEKALASELPVDIENGTDIAAFPLVLRLISHVAACHFVGYPLCQDEEWLSTALKYTENAFRTIILIRIFPDWMKSTVSWFIPYAWKVSSALRRAQQIIVPLVVERRRLEQSALENDRAYTKPPDFLQWMMDAANSHDGEPHRLAHRLLILTLAAVHTTSMAATQAFFDLCSRSEYIEPLREEVLQVLEEDKSFKKTTLTKLRKLDSFIRESQRLNPPSLLGFKRAVKQPLELSDGTVLPQGAHLMMPVYPIVIDETVTPNPMRFDGFRHYEKRLLPGEANKHQFATTSNDNLHFGHGKYACPGRFFAANSVKLLLAKLLLDYEFDLADGGKRPENVACHEYVFPNPDARVILRKRSAKNEGIALGRHSNAQRHRPRSAFLN
ncbi:MAG: hypothetical protein M1820_007862 [Bogoriella megaspora]|nr:MAG: hypothetical protein M1820_007862 [Bogoriella megaspora]